MNQNRRAIGASYMLSMPRVLLLGSILSAAFFGLLYSGPLDFPLLRRYCLSHPVAIATIVLFFNALVVLFLKWSQASVQGRATAKAAGTLRKLIAGADEIRPADRPQWLAASWSSQPTVIRESWFGARILRVAQLQISRGRRHQMENDLKAFSEADADQQHESYGLLRIINWAMPMLGFLGTVLGISQTLGQMDTQMLATQQQEAMNQLTAGLYVAFDTTAIALVLTVVAMFGQFAVSRIELTLLARIDNESADCMIPFLAADPFDAQDTLLVPVRDMVSELIASVQRLTEEQAAIWSRSISETQRQWADWKNTASQRLEDHLGSKLGQALAQHLEGLEKLHASGSRQVELRWQQWQRTLSDQARTMQEQQKQMIRQSESLENLTESTVELRKLEETIHESVVRLENISRIEDAAQCVGEAVAMLAGSLERAGVIRNAPVKPRAKRSIPDSEPLTDISANLVQPSANPIQSRKAA